MNVHIGLPVGEHRQMFYKRHFGIFWITVNIFENSYTCEVVIAFMFLLLVFSKNTFKIGTDKGDITKKLLGLLAI